jgi:F-type H+-transporting ATPase subunit b
MLNFTVTFFITIVNLAVLFVIMRAILYKPVKRFMDARSKAVADTISAAEHNRDEAKSLMALARDKLDKAELDATTEARAIVEQAQKEAAAILDEARVRARATQAAAEKAAEAERKAAWLVFKAQAAALVTAACAKLLRREITSADARAQAEAILEAMTAKQEAA